MKNFIYQILSLILLLFLGCDKQSEEEPNEPDEGIDLSTCLTSVSNSDFEILTWNIKDFPYRGDTTVNRIQQIITEQKPDVIAFQEIFSPSVFEDLTENLEGYESELIVIGSLNLGFMYKKDEITLEGKIEQILEGDFYAFPRPPAMIKVNHSSGFTTTLINIHLKCCDGTDNYKRRKDASEKLKEYIDTNLPDEEVVLLGDFNDEIYGIPNSENPFINFIDDSENYVFADMELALSDKDDWSYPGWPSHIDHILISDELFDFVKETITLQFDACDENYFRWVTDHRPIMLKLGK